MSPYEMEMEANVCVAEPEDTEEEERRPSVKAEPVKVLLIEDNPGDARLIQIMVCGAGDGLFEVEEVERLGLALNRLGGEDIGLVLCDLFLPDSQGLDTFARLYAHAPTVPIIVLSGLNDTRVAVEAVHEGAQDYLIKGQVDGQLLVRSMRYAIERKRLTEQLGGYAEELRVKNAQLEADFNMAREIQQIFLPQQYPTFPHWAGPGDSAIQFSHKYLPAAAVGGDFFDILPITDTAAGVFLCDVMGHGMRAALVTAVMRGLIEELIPVAADAGKFLSEVNRSLHAILRRTRDPFLATAFYLVVDVAGSELRFSSAGHPSPFLIRRSAGTVLPLTSIDSRHGPALGLFGQPTYPTCRCPLAANDLLFLFTDGIYEAESPEFGEYGQQRLLEAVRRKMHLAPAPLFEEVLRAVQDFSGCRTFEDDVCLIGVEAVRTANV